MKDIVSTLFQFNPVTYICARRSRQVAAAGYNAVKPVFGYGGLGESELQRVLEHLNFILASCS